MMGGKDPSPYFGPVQKLDGTRPWNNYLWPDEDWWITHEPEFRNVMGMFNFSIIHLWDGTFATDGEAWYIEKGVNGAGEKCVFPTRKQAIRASAARMIREIRFSKIKKTHGIERFNAMINWTLKKVADVTGDDSPRQVNLPAPPKPIPPSPVAGLELFEQGAKHEHTHT